jgi:hypothetical protein
MQNGTKVQITHTSNPFAKGDVGKFGVVTGEAPLGMIVVTLDDGREFWAERFNLRKVGA